MEPVFLKVWGCRGSYPAPFSDRMEYGGNTACISLEYGDRMIVLDAGSGIIPLGHQTDWAEKKKRADIFISHSHLDHVMGLFLFQPFFDPEMEIHLYGSSPLLHQVETLIRPPYWPLDIKSLPARVEYHTITAKNPLELFPLIRVETIKSSHPGECLSYRFELEGRRILYGTDCEMDLSIWEKLVSFGTGCDLLICDAQYRPEELEAKKGWGHSSWQEGNRLLEACHAGQILHTHFDWGASDRELKERERLAVSAQPRAVFAREGLVMQL